MKDCGERNGGTTVIDDLLHRHRRDGAGSAIAEEEEEEVSKRRKVAGNNGVVLGLRSLGGLDISSPAKRSSDADGGTRSADSPSSSSSCCSSTELSDLVKDGFKLVDLEAKSNFESETADSTSITSNTTKTKFRETTPSSDLCADSDENTELTSPAETKYPPREEIEEFFAAAEKSDQKRFAEKYNYDIVKDLPLEGRYQWVSLKP